MRKAWFASAFGAATVLLCVLAVMYLGAEMLWYCHFGFSGLHEWGVSTTGLGLKRLALYCYAALAAAWLIAARRRIDKAPASESK